MNWEFTGETKDFNGITLKRIRAIKDFEVNGRIVHKGEVGGWIEKEYNLRDNAWVGDAARVYGNALVYGNAIVCGDAQVYGDAWVYGNACVNGKTQVCGTTMVGDDFNPIGTTV